MKQALQNIAASFSHLLFPHNCLGCATDVLQKDEMICAKCLTDLPQTNFENANNNPIEKTFLGRLKIEQATAGFYFSKDSLLQHLIKQLKYHKNQDVGFYLGELLGNQLLQSKRFDGVEALIPLPLNEKKEFIRGYNQAEIICKGIATVFKKPIIKDAVVRKVFTQSQTTESRIKRWQNMEGVFALHNENSITNKHLLLVDDVITTGATIESCGTEILKASNTKLSVAGVAFAI